MSLQINSNGSHALSGSLSFDTVATIYGQNGDAPLEGTVDLSGVTSVDSAGLALLLEWKASALARDSKLNFVNAPSDLRRLAVLSEAAGLLGIEKSNGH